MKASNFMQNGLFGLTKNQAIDMEMRNDQNEN